MSPIDNSLWEIFLKAFLIENIVIMRFIALCPFIGMSSNENKSTGMGLAVIFVTVLATCVTFPFFHYILKPLELGFLQILVFILVIASLVQLVEFFLKKNIPTLYKSMGIYLPLITVNCAIMAVVMENISNDFSLVQSLVYAVGVAMGFLLAMLLLAGIRRRIRISPIPEFLKGTPILFICTCLLSMAFLGLAGLIK